VKAGTRYYRGKARATDTPRERERRRALAFVPLSRFLQVESTRRSRFRIDSVSVGQISALLTEVAQHHLKYFHLHYMIFPHLHHNDHHRHRRVRLQYRLSLTIPPQHHSCIANHDTLPVGEAEMLPWSQNKAWTKPLPTPSTRRKRLAQAWRCTSSRGSR